MARLQLDQDIPNFSPGLKQCNEQLLVGGVLFEAPVRQEMRFWNSSLTNRPVNLNLAYLLS